jgi:HEAT repeat protein
MRTAARAAVLVVALVPGVTAAITRPPPAADFREQARRLEREKDKAARLDAIKWLNLYRTADNARLAIPALERCVRTDPEPEVRREAISVLCLIAWRLKQPCPLPVIEALLDREDEVRWNAAACAGLFKTIPPEATDTLLRAAASADENIRSEGLLFLARAAGKDPKALAAIETGQHDAALLVRQNAHVARFNATGEIEPFVRYIIHVREEPDASLRPVPKDAEKQKQEQVVHNLFLLGSPMRLIELGNERADELAEVLVRLLDDRSPIVRRGAVNLIGAVIVKVDVPTGVQGSDWSRYLLPYLEQENEPGAPKKAAGPEKPSQKSKAAERLESRKVGERLRKLHKEDPDRSVRDAARAALDRLASVQPKKP